MRIDTDLKHRSLTSQLKKRSVPCTDFYYHFYCCFVWLPCRLAVVERKNHCTRKKKLTIRLTLKPKLKTCENSNKIEVDFNSALFSFLKRNRREFQPLAAGIQDVAGGAGSDAADSQIANFEQFIQRADSAGGLHLDLTRRMLPHQF